LALSFSYGSASGALAEKNQVCSECSCMRSRHSSNHYWWQP